MELKGKTIITVQAKIAVPIAKVWKFWTSPEDIIKWNNASDDWHTTHAENDLRVGGKFCYRMEAKDGSMGFDFRGTFDQVAYCKNIAYTIDDGRKVRIVFTDVDNTIEVVEDFEAESIHSVEMQRSGWQAILNSFKKYAEGNSK